ncbi:MAG: L,D-transpeptidase family protein, partial [Woeseiaceae bacterium]
RRHARPNTTSRGEPDAAQPLPIAERPEVEPIDPNRFVLDSPDDTVVGVPQVVFASATDTLSDLAREYGLGYDEIVAANPEVSPWLPGDGEPVLLPSQYLLPPVPKVGIVLNIASKRLFYFPKVGEGAPRFVLTFPIGIGRVGWETPLGAATIVSKAVEPSWYVPLSVRREHEELGDPLPAVVPPGPDNPLGSRVLKLSMPGYLIHGTNQPYGVGMRVSHGCVRLYPENIEFLYELVETGEPVMIVNEPYLLGSAGGEWYFESHAPLEDDVIDPQDRLAALFESAGEDFTAAMQVHARSIASMANGFAIRVSAYDTYEVFARLQRVENTVEVDADAPTLEEVREMIEEAVAEAELEREAIGAEEPPEQVAN